LRQALARRDTTLLGVVLNVLLAWPDCCFRPEVVKHPRSRDTLAFVPSIFEDDELMPKEQALLDLCLAEKARNRKVLAYSVYTGTRDTTSRMKRVLEQSGLKVAVLRASVDTARREDWILDQVDRGVDVLITNPELVKTGLDLLDFPTIAFMQTGYNVYTVQQAARRSWRIGQKQDVRVIFFGYIGSSQITCLQLMAKKIAVSQSTSGDVPESGLDSLNQDGDSVEMALARQLINA
ncbi:helicase-related protein, partial [Pseudomonas syringae]